MDTSTPTTPLTEMYDSDPEVTSTRAFVDTSEPLKYAITHVFLPVNLPKTNDCTLENDHALALAVCTAARTYTTHICGSSDQAQWHRITKMLDNLQVSVETQTTDDACIISQLRGMQTGGTFTNFLQIRADDP